MFKDILWTSIYKDDTVHIPLIACRSLFLKGLKNIQTPAQSLTGRVMWPPKKIMTLTGLFCWLKATTNTPDQWSLIPLITLKQRGEGGTLAFVLIVARLNTTRGELFFSHISCTAATDMWQELSSFLTQCIFIVEVTLSSIWAARADACSIIFGEDTTTMT